ncbi:MAG: ATP-binding cassette domain-containing protein [Chitinivibrionales bacterium]|nr:ATP-binding cassette domain-containing protein [Chitinivibrionales bacterium]
MPENIAIDVRNASKCFGNLVAVNNLTFSVPESSCIGFLGPNGAGKSTMMHMVYGRCRREYRDDSSISVFGYDPVDDELAIKYLAGVVSQDNNLDTELNVTQNLMIYAKFYAIAPHEAKPRISRLLEFMELGEKHDARIRELSGGMQRRLVIVRALLNEPRLLILDEPTTGLDPQVRHAIWEKIRQLKKQGLTVLLTTHYMEEAFQIADNVVIMHKGERVLEGPPRDVVNEQIENYVLELLRSDALEKLKEKAQRKNIRNELSRDVSMFYAQSLEDLQQLTETLAPGDFILRHSNLEDVFLKATGRGLNEAQ